MKLRSRLTSPRLCLLCRPSLIQTPKLGVYYTKASTIDPPWCPSYRGLAQGGPLSRRKLVNFHSPRAPGLQDGRDNTPFTGLLEIEPGTRQEPKLLLTYPGIEACWSPSPKHVSQVLTTTYAPEAGACLTFFSFAFLVPKYSELHISIYSKNLRNE